MKQKNIEHSSGEELRGLLNSEAFFKSRYTQTMTNHFWKRFVVEYLSTITRASKWLKLASPLIEGEVVMRQHPLRNEFKKGVIT